MTVTIAVDLDEVLGLFLPNLNTYYNQKFTTDWRLSDFFTYHFCEVWRCSEEQGEDVVYEFFKTDYFRDIPVVPGAREGLAALKAKGFRLIVVTSRQLVIEEATREWLRRNFPDDTFDDVAFGNHWGKKGPKTSKSDLCKELGASFLIDDNYNYIEEVSKAGIHGILFSLDNSYPWNKSENLPERAVRASSWASVVEQILKVTEASS